VTVERISMFLLALIALVMGANYVSASSRFLNANRAYEGLELQLESFTYRNARSPIYYSITVGNPAGTAIEVLALRTTVRAGAQLVGGGEIYSTEVLSPGDSTTYAVTAQISDIAVLERAEAEGSIDWLIRGELQVRLDEDVESVWVQFSVRAVSP
jgi:hypothetical protein